MIKPPHTGEKQSLTLNDFELSTPCDYLPLRRLRNKLVYCETLCDSVGHDSEKSKGITGRHNILNMFKNLCKISLIAGKNTIVRFNKFTICLCETGLGNPCNQFCIKSF